MMNTTMAATAMTKMNDGGADDDRANGNATPVTEETSINLDDFNENGLVRMDMSKIID